MQNKCDVCKRFNLIPLMRKMYKCTLSDCPLRREEQMKAWKRNKLNNLKSQIVQLKPRIEALILTANTASNNDIDITGKNNPGAMCFVCTENADNIGFYTVSNKYRFIGISGNDKNSRIFLTDGSSCFIKSGNGKSQAEIEDMEKFLRCFDIFEKSFYNFIDKTIGYDPKKTFEDLYPVKQKENRK